jgi:hypothetical protein
MRDAVNDYLGKLERSRVRSLAEIIEFNDENPDLQAGLGEPHSCHDCFEAERYRRISSSFNRIALLTM